MTGFSLSEFAALPPNRFSVLTPPNVGLAPVFTPPTPETAGAKLTKYGGGASVVGRVVGIGWKTTGRIGASKRIFGLKAGGCGGGGIGLAVDPNRLPFIWKYSLSSPLYLPSPSGRYLDK